MKHLKGAITFQVRKNYEENGYLYTIYYFFDRGDTLAFFFFSEFLNVGMPHSSYMRGLLRAFWVSMREKRYSIKKIDFVPLSI